MLRLIGYAVSSQRTLADFFQRLAPFGAAFMALFGRVDLPHRASTLSFSRECRSIRLEAVRQLFEQ